MYAHCSSLCPVCRASSGGWLRTSSIGISPPRLLYDRAANYGVSLSLAPFIASAGSSPDFNRIGWIAPPFPESWRTVDSGLRFPSVQVTYLMTVIQFCGRPSTLPLTNQLQPSTSKTDKKLLRFFKKFWNIKKASASTLETEVIFQYTKSVVNAKTAAPDYSDATVKLLQMCDFWGILPTSTRIGIRLAHVGIQPGFSVS